MAINESYGKNGNGETPEVIEHAARMVGEARALGRSISETSQKLQSSLDLAGRVNRAPIASVFIAVGIGYVLGGGLFSPVIKKVLKVGVRLALIFFIRGQIVALAGPEGAASS